jgi:hypothetical protein
METMFKSNHVPLDVKDVTDLFFKKIKTEQHKNNMSKYS